MSNELEAVANSLQQARSYLDVFGDCGGEKKDQQEHVKRIYRRLARTVHPDLYTGEDEKQLAEAAFQALQVHLTAANTAIADGIYGQLPVTVIRTKHYEHAIGPAVKRGDIAELFKVSSTRNGTSVPSILKLARSPADSDLIEAESRALKRLSAADGDERFYPFFPKLVDSFIYRASKGRNRRGNVLERLDGWYSLSEIRQMYPTGVADLDMIWIWRRLLYCMGYAHRRGLAHGAVLPDHVMIQPEKHGLKLVDWCYSVNLPEDGTPAQPIKAISRDYRAWYPPEVLNREPPSPATDIYMAVKSMVDLIGGDARAKNPVMRTTKGMRAFFRGCTQDRQRFRPQDAWGLLAEFDELLERHGKPYFPRRFREFKIPA